MHSDTMNDACNLSGYFEGMRLQNIWGFGNCLLFDFEQPDGLTVTLSVNSITENNTNGFDFGIMEPVKNPKGNEVKLEIRKGLKYWKRVPKNVKTSVVSLAALYASGSVCDYTAEEIESMNFNKKERRGRDLVVKCLNNPKTPLLVLQAIYAALLPYMHG